MFGVISFKIIIGIIALIAVSTDLYKGKIFNWLTLPSMVIGTLTCIYEFGFSGGIHSISGIFLGLLLYGWMFAIRQIGGGDVKLLMAFGAWGGIQFVLEVGVLSLLVGGVMSAILLLFQGKLLRLVQKIYYSMMALFIKELEFHFPKIDKKLTMPFGLPMAIASCWTAFSHPVAQWVLESGFAKWMPHAPEILGKWQLWLS